MLTDLRLKIRNFIKRNKRKLYLALIVWGIIIAINYLIKYSKSNSLPSTTYEPHNPIMGGDAITSKSKQKQIETIIDKYINYCNNGQYEEAYELLSKQCINSIYPTYEQFREDIQLVFDTKKAYAIQSYFNDKDMTVYRIRLFEDILATGTTNEEEFGYVPQIITVLEENGKMVLSINGFIKYEELKSVYEDKYIKMNINDVKKEYETEIYNVSVTNKTEYRVSIFDMEKAGDVELLLSVGKRSLKNASNTNIILAAGETRTFNLRFTRYYHESDISRAIKFNDIRILRTYPPTYDEEGNITNLIDEYSIELTI